MNQLALILGAAMVCSLATDAGATPPISDLRLAVSVGDSMRVEGAPVLVAIRLSNGGHTTASVPPIHPAYGYVDFTLTTQGKSLRCDLPDERGRIRQGMDLASGESEVEVVDILPLFGQQRYDSRTISDALHSRALPIGTYKLTVYYNSSLDHSKSGLISAESVDFTVVPLASKPAEEKLVTEFLTGWVWKQSVRGRNEYCRRWIERFADSQFLTEVYLCSGPLMRSVSPAFILAQVAQRTPRAYMMGLRCLSEQVEDGARVAWLDGVLAMKPDSLTRDVLTSWKRTVHQGKFSYP